MKIYGGDGMQIQIDKRNPNIVFTFSLEIIIESIVPPTNASTFRQSRKDENHSVSIGKHLFYCLLTIKIFCIWDPIYIVPWIKGQRTISPDLTNGTK
jgi:hypothetical protein